MLDVKKNTTFIARREGEHQDASQETCHVSEIKVFGRKTSGMKLYSLFFIFCFGIVNAQDDTINKLDEIILTGNFSPVLNSGYEIKIISDSILSKDFESLGNLLQKQANFYFKQNGNGMVSSVSLRGTGASQTGVFWNGIAINSSLNGQTDFNTLQANGFDQLEIRKGGGTVLLGNGSIGGAINLKDKLVFQDDSNINVLLGAGSYQTFQGQINGRFSSEKIYAKISGGANVSENDYLLSNTDLYNENGQYKNFNLSTVLGYKINQRNNLAFYASAFDNDRNLSRTLTSESKAKLKNFDRRIMLDWKLLGDNFTSSLKVAYLKEDFTYFFDKNEPNNSSKNESERRVGKYDFSYFLNKSIIFRAGLEFENSSGKGTSIAEVEQNDFTGYLLFHHQPLSALTYNLSLRTGASSVYDVPIIYSIDSRYEFNNSWSLRGAFSSNYRLPTFNDLYWEPGGNINLKPEKSLSGELGIDYETKVYRLNATTFFIKSTDLIQWQPVTSDFWQPINISSTSNYGIEFSGELRKTIGPHQFQLNAHYDFTQAVDDEIDEQLIYVPRHKALGIFNYSWKKWNFNYHLQYVGKVYTTTSNSQYLNDYWLSDIEFSRSFLNSRLFLAFKINNLFDKSYQSVAYRPMPNSNYLLNINFKI